MAANLRIDPRKMMMKAIEVMQLSIAEHRDDKKKSPAVGAVLVKPDGMIDTAHRGELREGDHAEFTLLERKNRANRLDGSVLFATLEPCAPGARNHPKLSCAERIVLARIKTVWVGITDPDPTVDGKGKKHLEDNGVEVLMFDQDLQVQIVQANSAFIKQAQERAAAVEDAPAQEVLLSEYENVNVDLVFPDLEPRALEAYAAAIGEKSPVNSVAFKNRLQVQNLLREDVNGLLKPTGFGSLLFAKFPRDSISQAGLLATIHYDNGSEEVQDFDGPMVFIPEAAIQWLKDKLPNPIDRSDARRKDANESLFELVREGIINALVHRDYGVKGAKCHLIVTPDTVVVKSPGKPVLPITVEQMQDFSAPMLSRNPILHLVFARMELAEERGLGLKSMKTKASKVGLPLPKYTWEAPYLVLTLYRSADSVTRTLAPEIFDALSKAELVGWKWLATHEAITSAQYALAMGLPNRTALNHLKRFGNLGLVVKVGSGSLTKYSVLRR